MTDHRREVHRSQTVKDEFLLSKTDVEARYGSTDEQAISISSIRERFPDALDEPGLRDAAMKKFASARKFGAMIIRIDDINRIVAPETIIGKVAGIIDSECKSAKGLWGLTDHHVFGCYLPKADEKACSKVAENIRRKLAEDQFETVSIGIGIYPTIVFGKEDILDNAKKALDHAEFFGPDSCVAFDSVSLNISGDKLYQEGNIEGAMAEYNLALTLDPENINVHNSIGVCHGVKGDLDMALAAFEIALKLDSDEVLAVYNAGYVHILKKEYEKALERFQRAVRIDDGIFEINFQTGRVLVELERYADARPYLEKAIALNNEVGAAHRYLGDCYAAAGELPEAISAYKTALKLRPDDACSISALGYYYETMEQNAEIALMFCEKAVEMEQENGLFRFRLGWILLNRGRHEDALVEFESARKYGYDCEQYIQETSNLLPGTDEKHSVQHS